MSRTTKVGLAMLLAGAVVGAAGVQAVQSLEQSRFLRSGLFTLARGEAVNFSVSLDDAPTGPPAKVLMRLFDPKGTVVARQEVMLGPGQSANLVFRQPGVYRAHARVLEPDSPLGSQRIALSTVEIFGPDDDDPALAIPRRFVCSADDGAGNGRLPD